VGGPLGCQTCLIDEKPEAREPAIPGLHEAEHDRGGNGHVHGELKLRCTRRRVDRVVEQQQRGGLCAVVGHRSVRGVCGNFYGDCGQCEHRSDGQHCCSCEWRLQELCYSVKCIHCIDDAQQHECGVWIGSGGADRDPDGYPDLVGKCTSHRFVDFGGGVALPGHRAGYAGIVTITSNAAQGAATINMSGAGVPSLSGLTCTTQSYSAAGMDSCLVSLNGTAAGAGFTVSLASNNSSVTVPASVTVPPGAMSASFTASVSAVSATQTATLNATAGGIAKSFGIQLAPGTAVLTANASSVPFGSVLINSPAEQSITLTASGTSPVTISSISITGAGFTDSGLTAPMVLNPGQSAVLNVQFTPTAAGTFTGQITIGSNATGGTILLGLSGTGYAHKVKLSWNAASSGNVVGYNVYRVLSGGTAFQRVNASALPSTTYTDGTVQCGASYAYYVTSLDGAGVESVPSNTTTIAIPNS
jgi:hypothetical protein